MSKKKPGFTMDEHQSMGAMLKGMQADLQRALVKLSQVYPVNSKPLIQARRALDALVELRSELDNAVFREHGDEASVHIYYG